MRKIKMSDYLKNISLKILIVSDAYKCKKDQKHKEEKAYW